MKILNLLTLVSLFIFVSCRKNVSEKAETNISMKSLDHDREMTDFAKVLAKSLTDINVRSLIKQEAEKMFDKDYDVLYGLAKDLPDVTGKTLNEQIVKFSNNPSQFNSIVNQLPLLTIYVPVLDNFDAKKWNIDGQIPIVAVRNTEDRKNGKPLLAYDADGNEIKLDYKVKPDRPIIVIKDNERVIKKSTEVKNNLNARGNEVTPVKIKDDYYFADESYNGYKKDVKTERIGYIDPNSRYTVLAELIDPRVVTAYQKKISPQRDFIYYGIDPNQGINSGPLNSGYAEFITSIQVNEYNSKSYIKDDFTDGMLEFHVTIFFLGRDGAGGSILKVFPCDPTKLFYDSSRVIGHPNGTSIYILPNPIPITDWNMQKYGSTWKVLVAEYDPGTEITQTSSMSSTFSSNFNFDVSLGETVKVGLKFGTSEVTVESGTITYKTTGSTDNLGEALLDYSAPVLLRIDSSWRTPMGQIYSINTGTVTLDIETRKRY